MKIAPSLALFCLLAVSPHVIAQTMPVAPANPSVDPKNAPMPVAPSGSPVNPVPAPPASAPLAVSEGERQYFRFGYSLAKAAFSYAELAKKATAISQVKDKTKALQTLGDLLPVAQRNRTMSRTGFVDALATMRILRATPKATATVSNAVLGLSKPLKLTGEALQLAALNPDAGQALASLNEFERLSGLSENPAIKQWIASPAVPAAGKVWYAEGLITGLAEIADQERMPDLLPPLSEIATDLRGMRDWLVLRFPDKPSLDQTQLKMGLDQFLRQTAKYGKSSRSLTLVELSELGAISRELRVQMLPDTAPSLPQPLAPPIPNTPPVAAPA